MTWPIDIDPTFGCWLWTGRIDREGYPVVRRGRTPFKAYLAVYESEVGPVPDGKVLDHLCRVRKCVAPHHLEPVSQSVNLSRREWGVRVRRKTCSKGHPMADAMVTSAGGRLCRTCARMHSEGDAR